MIERGSVVPKEATTPTVEPPSSQKPRETIQNLARQIGVSSTTISHAINGTKPIADATRQRIQQALEDTQYVPDPAGRNLGRSTVEGRKDKRKYTMQDVAKRSGVSPTTVSHIINNTRSVADDTRDRVQSVIGELGYTINPDAQALRKGKKLK